MDNYALIKEKLDRALVTTFWLQMFPNAKLENLALPSSDHFPILLDKTPVVRTYRAKKSFKFENAWRIEDGVNDVVRDSWFGSGGNSIINKLSNCAADLTHWSKTHCNKIREDIESCRQQLCRSRSTTGIQDVTQF